MIVNFGLRRNLGSVEYPPFWLPLNDAGSGAVNTTPSRGTGSATFTRAGATATTVLSTGLVSSTIAANTARSYYDPAPTGGTGSYMYLPGVSGAYASTPDSSANSITGDIDLRVQVALDDWTPANNQYLIAKDDAVGPDRAYAFFMNSGSGGNLRLVTSANGTTMRSAISTAATGFADGSTNWVRVTRSSTTGDVTFYTSSDGNSWAQLGNVVSTTAEGIINSAFAIGIGASTGGASNFTSGKIYRAQIYSGINGTLVADFDPTRTTQASTSFAASTGETWTINGRGFIYAAPAYLGYLAEEARTNLCLQSEDLSTTWTVSNSTVSTNATTAPDGASTADKIQEDTSTSIHSVIQVITVTTATVYTMSVFAKAAERSWLFLTESLGVTAGAYFNLGAGTVGTVSGTGSPSATIKAYPNGWFRCTLTFTSSGVSARVRPCIATADNTNSYLGTAGSGIYCWGAQLEAGAFATSYIPTAAATSTRAADVLTFPTSGNIDQTVGSAFCRFMVPQQNASVGQPLIANQLAAGNAQLYIPSGSSTQLACFDGTSIILSAAVSDFRNTVTRGASTWSGSERAIYVNGSSKNTGAFDGTYNGTAIHIGSNASAAQLNGCIRDIRIWQRVLSGSQIASIR